MSMFAEKASEGRTGGSALSKDATKRTASILGVTFISTLTCSSHHFVRGKKHP